MVRIVIIKKNLIKKLLGLATSKEARYIIRALKGNLRIGIAQNSVLAALAKAVTHTPPKIKANQPLVLDTKESCYNADKFTELLHEYTKLINQAMIEVPDYNVLTNTILNYPIEDLPKHCYLRPGIPVQVMLGKAAKGIDELIAKFGQALFTCEYKYDGERAQIHLTKDKKITVFSRNSLNVEAKYPDISEFLPLAYNQDQIDDFIIDCEVVAYDVIHDKILPFQTLSTRKRKNTNKDTINVQICLFAFDLLYLNGKSYLNETFQLRRATLRSTFKKVTGKFNFAVNMDSNNIEDIQNFLDQSIEDSCEGLMVKSLEIDAYYVPAKRNWLKLKKDYLDGVGDTLDLVVIGAWLGQGKRTNVYGSFLVATYDSQQEEYQSVCRVGTGFSDEDLQLFYQTLSPLVMDSKPIYYNTPQACDVWFQVVQVWEIAIADLSISPSHTAAIGMIDTNKGIAGRFPRFKRVRDDKPAENCTNPNQIVEMYNNQAVISANHHH